MEEIERIANAFSQSKLFRPDFEFIFLLRQFVDEGKSIQEIFAGQQPEIQAIEQISGETIDRSREERLLDELLSEFVTTVNQLLQKGIFGDKELEDLHGYTAIGLPFHDGRFHLCAIKTLFLSVDYLRMKHVLNLKDQKLQVPSSLQTFYNPRDDLIDVSSFRALDKGFLDPQNQFVIYPYLSYDLRTALIPIFRKNRVHLRLQVRPAEIGDYRSYSSIDLILEERKFGIPFTKTNLRRIHSKQYGVLEYHFKTDKERLLAKAFYVPLKRLEYVIKPYDNKNLSLSLEEVIDIDGEDHLLIDFKYEYGRDFYVKQRLLHVLFDRATYDIVHLDMSEMYYDFESYFDRLKYHLKDKITPASIKKKTFRIDGPLRFKDFLSLLIFSMDGKRNPEIINFVSGA